VALNSHNTTQLFFLFSVKCELQLNKIVQIEFVGLMRSNYT
jgi:hypothetical protein